MIYRIYYEGKRKFALPVKNREELMALRNSYTKRTVPSVYFGGGHESETLGLG